MTGSDDEVRVTRRLDASAEQVYDSFLDPGRARFMFATATGQIVRCDIEARVGLASLVLTAAPLSCRIVNIGSW